MTEELQKTNNTPDDENAAQTASIAPGYWIQHVLIALMCLVLGLWGIYDYVIVIPEAERMSQRREVTQSVMTAMNFESDGTASDLVETKDGTLKSADSLTALDDIDDMLKSGFEQPDVRPKGDAGQPDSDASWWDMLHTWKRVLQNKNDGEDHQKQWQQAGVFVDEAMQLYGDAQPPSAYDRPVQWMFIASLIFTPLYLWGVFKYGPRKYMLDESGTVHAPEGVFARDEIQDIDMSRWMSKSTADLVLVDGRRVELDAYIFKNLHLIIGSIAHRLHPEAWTEEAKKVKTAEMVDSAGEEEA